MTVTDQARPPAAPATGVEVGTVFSLGRLGEDRVLALAAAAPARSTDPVDEALAAELHADYPQLPAPQVGGVDPARTDRRYSLTRAKGVWAGEGEVMVMRGELAAVLKQTSCGLADRGLAKRNANYVLRRGFRPLAVASAPIGADGEPGAYTFEGFVALRPIAKRQIVTSAFVPNVWARVDVWSASLRFQHWLNVAMVFILSCTGYLIMDPFFGPVALAGESTGFMMGGVRFGHFAAGFLWLVIGLTRVVVSFTSRDRYLRWPSLWPLKTKEDVRNLGRTIEHYALIKKDGPLYLAHNPLQQLTYTALYVGCGLQMLSGFALFGLYHPENAFWAFVSTPAIMAGIPTVRLFHTMMMFGLWAFVIVHVYLAVRAESLERHGGISAMIGGGVWVRRGAKPVDAPEIE